MQPIGCWESENTAFFVEAFGDQTIKDTLNVGTGGTIQFNADTGKIVFPNWTYDFQSFQTARVQKTLSMQNNSMTIDSNVYIKNTDFTIGPSIITSPTTGLQFYTTNVLGLITNSLVIESTTIRQFNNGLHELVVGTTNPVLFLNNELAIGNNIIVDTGSNLQMGYYASNTPNNIDLSNNVNFPVILGSNVYSANLGTLSNPITYFWGRINEGIQAGILLNPTLTLFNLDIAGNFTLQFYMMGGGGGGGGSAARDNLSPPPDYYHTCAGGGGASGNIFRFEVSAMGPFSFTYSIGTGGAPGQISISNENAATDGGNGGDTIINFNGKTYTAQGGGGGQAGQLLVGGHGGSGLFAGGGGADILSNGGAGGVATNFYNWLGVSGQAGTTGGGNGALNPQLPSVGYTGGGGGGVMGGLGADVHFPGTPGQWGCGGGGAGFPPRPGTADPSVPTQGGDGFVLMRIIASS